MVNSSPVVSNQQGIHDNLLKVVAKHIKSDYIKPVAEHTAIAFAETDNIVQEFAGPIIVDSGCGTGESSYRLAEKYPEHLVLGIDKSAARLAKSTTTDSTNVVLIRADLVDMWRLMGLHNWPIHAHFIFYPNPWPKKQHLKRRWHAHPIFLCMLQLSKNLELRTNWEVYALEFVAAVEHLIRQGKFNAQISQTAFDTEKPVSHFEKKYADSGHSLFRIAVQADNC